MAMQSRRDLFAAHRLMTQRAALALLRGEPDVPDQPLRRLNVGTFAGVLVAVIAAGIFGIWGLLFHGAPTLQNLKGSLIIDKQTGQNYVFCKNSQENPNGNEICPVVNHASALLALATPGVTVQSVNQSSLTTTPQGPELGILGLPDLPSAGLLIKQPWSACTQTLTGVAGAANGVKTTTAVAAGFQPGGQPLGSTGLLLARSGSQQEWVIGNGDRWPIASATAAALFSGSAMPVTNDWLNALPLGSPFAAPFIAGRGGAVTGPTGTQVSVGTLYKTVVGNQTHYYVVQADGSLASITQTQESLLAQQGGLPAGTSTPPTLSPAQIGRVAGQLPDNGLPATDTNAVQASQSDPVCVVLSGQGPALTTQVEVGGAMPPGATSTGLPAGFGFASEVSVPPDKGALVHETGSSTSYILVTDGHRYAMASTSVPAVLGYSLSQAVQVPAGFVDLFPPGPGLSPAQAGQPVSVGTGIGGGPSTNLG